MKNFSFLSLLLIFIFTGCDNKDSIVNVDSNLSLKKENVNHSYIVNGYKIPESYSKIRGDNNNSIRSTFGIFLGSFRSTYKTYGSYAEVGYGMMPFSYCSGEYKWMYNKEENSWLSFNILSSLVKDRKSQEKLWNYSKNGIIYIYKNKKQEIKALDLFIIWKTNLYLENYHYNNEVSRSKKGYQYIYDKNGKYIDTKTTYSYWNGRKVEDEAFTNSDWKGRLDSDSKIYAFCHRRILDYKKTRKGFSRNDLTYWFKIILKTLEENSDEKTLKLFEQYKSDWKSNKITSIDL